MVFISDKIPKNIIQCVCKRRGAWIKGGHLIEETLIAKTHALRGGLIQGGA